MDVRLPVRLNIINGESFSGYIMRSARAMNIDCREFLKYLVLTYNIHYKIKDTRASYFKIAANIDIYPFGILNEKDICFLFNKSREEIEGATFKNIFDVLNINFDTNINPYKIYVNKDLVKEVRRFCPLCLKENGIYKLIWQIREIEVCEIHRIKLINNCSICNTKQRYFGPSLEYHRCNNCNSLLWESKNKQEDFKSLDKQEVAYKNWEFLLTYRNKLVKLIPGYNFEQSLAIIMLYIAQKQEEKFCLNNISEFHPKTIENIIKFINTNENGTKISFSSLRKITNNNNILLSDLPNMNIPSLYIDSLIKEEDTKIKTFICLSPWCNYFGKNNKIVMLGKYQSKYTGVVRKFICTQCYMKFGYNLGENILEPLNKNLFNNIDKVRELVLKNKNQKEIANLLGISTDLCTKIFPYLIINNLLNDDIQLNKPIIVPNNIRDEIEFLLNKGCLTSRKASKIFGWSYFQFYYYFWLPEVQNFLMEREKTNTLKKRPYRPEKKDWKKELLKTIDYFWINNIDINYENIRKESGISYEVLKTHDLIKVVKISIMLQKNKRKLDYYIYVIKRLKDYLDKNWDKAVAIHEVFSYCEIKNSFIKRHYPNFKKAIIQKINIHNKNEKVLKIENYKRQIESICLHSKENGEIETIRSISIKLGKNCDFISSKTKLGSFTRKLLESNDLYKK